MRGVATAWALARRGVDVVVVEREDAPGRFASGRSAGLGRQLAEDDATSRLTIRGAEVLRGELAAVWQPCGGILSFDDRAAADDYEARAARLGVTVERMDRAAVTARWPGVGALPIAAALHVPSDGVIDVGALLATFAGDLAIVCGVRVALVEPSARGARLVTARGALEARLVVDAAGAWAGELTGEPPLASFKRHVYVLEAAGAGAPFLWHIGADEVYVRADGTGILVSPCDAAATAAADQQPDAVGEAALQTRLAGTSWSDAPIARRWACQRAFTPDRTMRLGRDPVRPWLVWAAGLGGHGATASAAVGEVVADACLAGLR
ncbi:MAG TPA: FAD-dependent oxidoreductase [Kofleriaceae bacterium]|nr:FAD-dependent oxidoreductase [Kofleriaceae bacterium]